MQRKNDISPARRFVQLLAAAALTVAALAATSEARADYALLQDGRGLFNVRVVDTQSTAAGNMQVIFKPESFGYNFYTDSPFLLRGHSDVYKVADYVTTSTQVGKEGARRFMGQKAWHRYTPPPPRVIPVFSTAPPTPVPTATPVPPPPENVADPSLPIEQRIQRQLDIFIHEQTTLAEQLKLLSRMGTSDPEKGKQQRVDLLKIQVQVLENYYPSTDDLVIRAREALQHQQSQVAQSGKFNFED